MFTALVLLLGFTVAAAIDSYLERRKRNADQG